MNSVLEPKIYGKKIIDQIIFSYQLIDSAKEEATTILSEAKLRAEKIVQSGFQSGLLSGCQVVYQKLCNSSNLYEDNAIKLETTIFRICNKILTEILVDESLKSSLSLLQERIKIEIIALTNQLDSKDTKIILEVCAFTSKEEIESIEQEIKHITVKINSELKPGTFKLITKYGEIESNPLIYVTDLLVHLKTKGILKDLSEEILING